MSDSVKIVPCNGCGEYPKLVPAKQITGKNHPAKGVKLSRAYVICTCGWAGAMCETDADAVREWNRVMGGKL